MGQPMSRIFDQIRSYFPFEAIRRQQQGDGGHGMGEYSGDELSSTIGGGKGCGSMSGGLTFFGNHFLMGGELYDTARLNHKPEVFLFGDQQDLDLLGNKPVKFPHCSKSVTDSVNVLNALVNVRKDSVKFTKVGRAGGGCFSGFYRLEFIFDCDVSCYVQIHFCAKEIIDEHQGIQIVSRQTQFNSSERYHFPIGANQQFSHFIFKPHRYDLKLMHWDGGCHFPVVIEIRSVTDQFPEQVQMTMCSIERSADQSAALILKPLKQKLISNGVIFLLQEIFGIENKENAECAALAEENGAECIICMANPRDTMILPCRHLCICNGCAETLRYKLNNCPICRSPFKALLKIRVMRSNLIGMGSDGTASTMRIRREPMTLFEAINGPFHSAHSGATPLIHNKTHTLAKCVGNRGTVVTTATDAPHTTEILNSNTNTTSPKSANFQRQALASGGGTSKIVIKKRDPAERVELNIEHIELEELNPKRRKSSHSSFIQYSPGSNSITRRSSPSPPPSLWRAHSPFSIANSSYQSARSIAQKADQPEDEREENEKAENDHGLPASAPNLFALELEEGKTCRKEQEMKKPKNDDEDILDGRTGEKRLAKMGAKLMSEPPPTAISSSAAKSSIPVKQRPKSLKSVSGNDNAKWPIDNEKGYKN